MHCAIALTVTRTPEGPAPDCSVGVRQTLHFGGSCFGPSAPELADEVTPLSKQTNFKGRLGQAPPSASVSRTGGLLKKVCSSRALFVSPLPRFREVYSPQPSPQVCFRWVVWVCSQFFQGAKFLFLHGNFNASTYFPRVWGAPHNRALWVSRLGKALAKR